jgi:hypothetical protein
VAQLPAFGLEQAGLGSDRNGLCGRTYFERNVQSQGLRYLDHDVLTNVFLESGHGHGQLIRARRQLRQSVISGSGSSPLVNSARLGIPGGNRGIGDHGAGRVGNTASNGGAVTLAEGGGREQEQCENSKTHETTP